MESMSLTLIQPRLGGIRRGTDQTENGKDLEFKRAPNGRETWPDDYYPFLVNIDIRFIPVGLVVTHYRTRPSSTFCRDRRRRHHRWISNVATFSFRWERAVFTPYRRCVCVCVWDGNNNNGRNKNIKKSRAHLRSMGRPSGGKCSPIRV